MEAGTAAAFQCARVARVLERHRKLARSVMRGQLRHAVEGVIVWHLAADLYGA